MVDNSSLPVASGNETFANDDIAGVKYPRAKMTWGPDGTANDTDVASGKPLPVQNRHSDGTILSDATGLLISTSQLAANRTTAGTMSNGFQLVGLPTDAALPAGTNHLGQIQTAIQYIDVTLSLDTAAYASGDLIADAQIVAACTRANDVPAILQSIQVIDEDDAGAAFTIYLANASASWGSENSAPSISDANARAILGFVDVATADYKDLGGVKVASKNNLGIVVQPASGTDDIYVAVVNSTGTPTYTASGVRLRLGFI